jgi:dipeptidyl aminopeptidase/acylaminoacyl peptidase
MFLFITMLTSLQVKGQSYKKMTPEVYSQWNKITSPQISDYGNTVIYQLQKEIGDQNLAIYITNKDTTLFRNRVKQAFLDPSGKYVIYTHNLSYDSTRVLKKKKTDKNKFPKDTLSIIDLSKDTTIVFPNVEKVYFPSEFGKYVLFTVNRPDKKADTISIKIDSLTIPQTETPKDQSTAYNPKKDSKSKAKVKDQDLYIYNLYSKEIDTIHYVSDFYMAEEASELTYVKKSGDSTVYYSVYLYSIEGKAGKIVLDSLAEVTNLSMDKMGNRLAFLALKDKSKAKQPNYDLYIHTPRDKTAHKAGNGDYSFLAKNWVISKDKKLSFSESGKKLYFGVAPILPIQDTTLLEDEIVNVEIWKYDTPRLYTEMNVAKDKDLAKTFTVLYSLSGNSFQQLETEDMDIVMTSAKGDGKYALGIKTKPYRKMVTWLGESPSDLILLNTEDGTNMIITEKEYGRPQFSPSGKYLYWWNRNDSIWKVFNTDTKILSVMGLWSTSKFYDEENDVPQKADPYGIAGWMPGDSIAIMYDRYDLWQMKPSNPFFSKKLTNGRSNKDVFRYIRLNTKEDYIPVDDNILLHVFNENSKKDQYQLLLTSLDTTTILFQGEYKLSRQFYKSKASSKLLFTKENFQVFPDLLLTDTTFTSIKKISDANPQQKEYGWGHAELISWTNYTNKKNEGMLFFPPDFDPDKQYPMIVNFYEKSSDDLYKYRAPEAHRSTINYTYYTNHGYIVFNPDIRYTSGQPGKDCYNAVESGVDYLIDQGYVNPDRLALQGHSWGGYQVAYLLTQTDRYRCAESGAPVVNMVSAYGGIRWESGMSRMFQYEKAQSRLGLSLWEDPEIYHANSPIYNMTKVKTPVLILHNDMDGAVPWYQGIEYFMALRRLNKPAWLLNYNNEPHWPVKWQNRLDFNIRMEQFFNYYLKDAPMPLWMQEGNTPLEKGILNKY